LTRSRIACRAVIEKLIIPFAVYTAAETPMLFIGPDDSQKLPRSRGGIPTSFKTCESAPQTASLSVQPFCKAGRVPDRQTDRPRYV